MQQKRYANKRIMTEIVPEQKWWDAEDYHQQCACPAPSTLPRSGCETCMHAVTWQRFEVCCPKDLSSEQLEEVGSCAGTW